MGIANTFDCADAVFAPAYSDEALENAGQMAFAGTFPTLVNNVPA